MRAGEILDARADLLDRLVRDPNFRRHQILAATGSFSGRPGPIDTTDLRPGEAFVETLEVAVKTAYAYRVTHDMGMVLEHTATMLDESDTFDRQMAPTGTGIVRFDRPITVHDVRGKKMLVHWMVWGPGQIGGKPGLFVACYNDLWTEPDEVYTDFFAGMEKQAAFLGHRIDPSEAPNMHSWYQQVMGRWASVSQFVVAHGKSLGPPTMDPDPEQQAWVIAQGDTPHSATNLPRYLHALFLLLNQTITKVEDEIPDRPARRRAEKAGFPSKVVVIRLRRVEGSARAEGESLVEWSHRWLVRGHLRWQPYGPRVSDHKHVLGEASKGASGHSERHCIIEGCNHHVERIYINAFIKGPAGAPLIVSDKVYELGR